MRQSQDKTSWYVDARLKNLLQLVEKNCAPIKKLRRQNFSNKQVSLIGGVLTTLLLSKSHAIASLFSRKNPEKAKAHMLTACATFTAGACGLFDDLDTNPQAPKGLGGHLRALKKGQITTGAVKILVLGFTGFVAAAKWNMTNPPGGPQNKLCKPSKTIWNIGRDTVLIASVTNLYNLLDLRPGRALKAALAFQGLISLLNYESMRRTNNREKNSITSRLAAVNIVNIVMALPSDLRQITMLGDTGANALGMAVGFNAGTVASQRAKNMLTVLCVGLNLLSEKLSFSRVIERVPFLDWLDRIGTDR